MKMRIGFIKPEAHFPTLCTSQSALHIVENCVLCINLRIPPGSHPHVAVTAGIHIVAIDDRKCLTASGGSTVDDILYEPGAVFISPGIIHGIPVLLPYCCNIKVKAHTVMGRGIETQAKVVRRELLARE